MRQSDGALPCLKIEDLHDPLPDLLDAVIFETDCPLGGPLCDLAKTDLVLGKKINNRSLLFDAFYQSNQKVMSLTEELDEEKILATLEHLEGVSDNLQDIEPTGKNGRQLLNELRLAHDMCNWAIGRMVALKHRRSLTNLRPGLMELIGRYENLWMQRNRIGGLHESSSNLRNVVANLGD